HVSPPSAGCRWCALLSWGGGIPKRMGVVWRAGRVTVPAVHRARSRVGYCYAAESGFRPVRAGACSEPPSSVCQRVVKVRKEERTMTGAQPQSPSILVSGLAKTGTTGAYDTVRSAVPAGSYAFVFEPRSPVTLRSLGRFASKRSLRATLIV